MPESDKPKYEETIPDQIDGASISARKKVGDPAQKRLSSSDWNRKETTTPIVQSSSPASAYGQDPILISIGPPHRSPLVSSESQSQCFSIEDENLNRHQQRKYNLQYYPSQTEAAFTPKTMGEQRSVLRQSSPLTAKGQNEGRSYPPGQRVDCKPDQEPSHSFNTFRPLSEARSSKVRERSSTRNSGGFSRTDEPSGRCSGRHCPNVEATNWADVGTSHSDRECTQASSLASQSFISDVERIKQQIVRDNINFVRFEATDLHGVSRSKTIPARFFHEKAIYGISMPRSYLESTLSPKVNEVDHASAANFSIDVLLIPDLSTFQILPWADQTARLICDPCTITGIPLRTSPRLIAKVMLGQLQNMGFSLHSSFSYECCIFGFPERMGPKAVFFPATTLLSNHDQPFLQQLVKGMYNMGVDVESFSSGNGPGQMEICFKPRFGIDAADSAFTFRTGIKEMAKKFDYIATFFTYENIHNAGLLSHSLWDAGGRKSLFHSGNVELSEIGRKWLSGLLHHSAALSCLLAPGTSRRIQVLKEKKDSKKHFYATCGNNDNSCDFNIKLHGGRGTHIDNKLGSAMANPYIVLAATIAAGLDGVRRNLNAEHVLNRAPNQQKHFPIPVDLDDALTALADDSVICAALGEPFVQYFIAMKRVEIENQEDADKNEGLEYFI